MKHFKSFILMLSLTIISITDLWPQISCGDTGIVQYMTAGTGNLMRMFSINDGSIAYRRFQNNFGLEYPMGSNYSLVYAGGFYFGGQKTGYDGAPDTINTAYVEFYPEFRPGRILNQGPFSTLTAEDYMHFPTFFVLPGHEACWPPEAPHKMNGDPLKLSAIDSWTVFNDLDLSLVNDPYSLSPGFGLEIQRMTFQFDDYPFNNAVLVRLRFINKSDKTYDSCYVGLWDDPDVGYDSNDDLSSVDSALSVLITYSTPNDIHPAAYGCLLLQGPVVTGESNDSTFRVDIHSDGFYTKVLRSKKTMMATAALHYPNPSGEPSRNLGDITQYYYIQGKDALGNPKPNGPFDLLGQATTPDQQIGTLGTGPFSFAPNDTQDIWYAMVGGYASNATAAKDTVLYYAQIMRSMFYSNMNDFLVDVKDLSGQPKNFTLFPNYPNPFNPSTTIRYELKQTARVKMRIYNLLGQEVRTLVNKQQTAGMHSVIWDGKNNRGQRVTSGVYFYRLQAGDFVKTRKMVLVK